MTVWFTTLGCKANQYDSGALMEAFRQAGVMPYGGAAPDPHGRGAGAPVHGLDAPAHGHGLGAPAHGLGARAHGLDAPAHEPDIVVVNTCAVTGESERKSRQAIRRARANYPNAALVVVGCYSQRAPGAVAAIEGVDIVAGTQGQGLVVQKALGILASRGAAAHGDGGGGVVGDANCHQQMAKYLGVPPASGGGDGDGGAHGNRNGPQSRARALIKIQDGCGRRCSYCIIPDVRGPSRSREAADIQREAVALASRGVREIVLTGIHISSYGLDGTDARQRPDARQRLGGLVAMISEAAQGAGLRRLRLSSLDPADVTPAFVEELARSRGMLCPHFHLSLQSGSAGVLMRMGRRYTPTSFLEAAALLRGAFPGAAVTTDVIVGFPGETDAEFAETMAFCREAAFSMVHVFKYSARPGTPAATMRGQVAPPAKAERAKRLLALADELAAAFNSQFVGETVSVLVESARPASPPSPHGAAAALAGAEQGGIWVEGTTAHYVKASATMPQAKAPRPGELCDMLATRADAAGLACAATCDGLGAHMALHATEASH